MSTTGRYKSGFALNLQWNRIWIEKELLVENTNNGVNANVGVFQAANVGVFKATNVGVFHQHCFMSTTGRYKTGYALNLE